MKTGGKEGAFTGPREDTGENLLGDEKERRQHREYLEEMEREWREEKRRRIEREVEPPMGWSGPRAPDWPESAKDEDVKEKARGSDED